MPVYSRLSFEYETTEIQRAVNDYKSPPWLKRFFGANESGLDGCPLIFFFRFLLKRTFGIIHAIIPRS